MADELIINKINDSIFIKSLDKEIFKSRVDYFLKNNYSLVGEIEISKHGLCKAQLKKVKSEK
tara:strand:- start:261 stop:446 length:186 start_codon:yes stop_codon:yes gene_type:complete